jgi:hypothetical protein
VGVSYNGKKIKMRKGQLNYDRHGNELEEKDDHPKDPLYKHQWRIK